MSSHLKINKLCIEINKRLSSAVFTLPPPPPLLLRQEIQIGDWWPRHARQRIRDRKFQGLSTCCIRIPQAVVSKKYQIYIKIVQERFLQNLGAFFSDLILIAKHLAVGRWSPHVTGVCKWLKCQQHSSILEMFVSVKWLSSQMSFLFP